MTRADPFKAFLRPDPSIAWEIRHDILQDRFGEPGAGITVTVRDGTVTLTGGLERRSQVVTLVRAVQAVEGSAWLSFRGVRPSARLLGVWPETLTAGPGPPGQGVPTEPGPSRRCAATSAPR